MDIPTTYTPKNYEQNIYDLWEKSGVFSPDIGDLKQSFSMTLPPPNANASLHLGQALDFQLKDVIARYQRLQGKAVLMLPGADHAGFETWYVYERQLREQGKSKFDFSREELYQQVWDFVELNRGTQTEQVRRLGISCDWTRFTYTLDDKIVKRAYQTFKKMWDDGLIYRGERLVNYCTFHQTGFSDIEVNYENKQTPLYYMKYGPFTLATTRPETKFGDTAVAVHPEDKRYKKYVDKEIEVDGLNGPFKLKVIADDYVDPEFGSGAVKITPAHDFNDWEIGQRHNLEVKRVIDSDGKLNELTGKYQGLEIEQARKQVVADLKEKGLLEKVDQDYSNRVAVCYKCGTAIEPMLMEQWFVSMQPLAKTATKHLNDNAIKFYPNKKKQEVINYLSEIRDWNISRQIAWGIPIPVFQNTQDDNDWIYDERVTQESIEVNGKTYQRDPDVFDTWWSSGQWPYATLDYPSAESDQFYPTNLMETGADLLRQWVSRMIMLGYYVTEKPPFKEVYFHGMILDEKGAKMSKSKGNVVNPMEVVDQYGADALRIGLINGTTAGNPQQFITSNVVGGRNFCNKLWNMARYVESSTTSKTSADKAMPKSVADHWILNRLNHASEQIKQLMDKYRVGEAYDKLYHFIWNDFADWYLEASKKDINQELLLACFEDALKLSHPFAPFVSEAIWQISHDDLLISQSWPEEKKFDPKQSAEFERIINLITETRFVINELGAHKPRMYFRDAEVLKANAKLITRLSGVEDVLEVEEGRGISLTQSAYDAWLDIDRQIAKDYVAKLKRDVEQQTKVVASFQARLKNRDYIRKAPKEVVDETKNRSRLAKDQLKKLEQQLANFEVASKSYEVGA